MMGMMKNLLIMLLLLFPLIGLGQEQLMGLIVEKDDEGKERPLFGANVHWLGTNEGAVTKENGVFLLELCRESNNLVVSYVGFANDTIEITNQRRIKVLLEPDNVLDEVTVEGWQPSSGINHLKGINTIEMDEDELFKAACCNLSESFETNPSVDVSFTDAVTGTRQIQMLGLAGPNSMISVENMPGIRGIAANYGLSYIPGTWINSIQVTKGVGSVVNGYESIAGQINVELKKPQESEKLFLNGYLNQSGRSEFNLNHTTRVGKKWATTTLLHGSMRPTENDQNNDNFIDLPVGEQVNFINRWLYKGDRGWIGQFGFKLLADNRAGGELDFDEEVDRNTTNNFGLEINTDRFDFWGKLGHVFDGKPYKSFGIQVSGSVHDQESYFGLTNYNANQRSYYTNFIYQSIISSTLHKFKTGVSFSYDNFEEDLNTLSFDRVEQVPGAFFEYTYEDPGNFTLIAGIRADYNNLFDELYLTPRLHMRYNLTESTVLRSTVGKGRRTANLIAENTGILASSRQVRFENQTSAGNAYGYVQDHAWNFGLNVSQDFIINYRNGLINVDFYHTKFQDQVILDLDRSPQEAVFAGLNGDSFSSSFQAQVDYEIARRWDIRMAYRWLNVEVDYSAGLLDKPLVPNNRAFFNTEYETKNGWSFDYTLQWTGEQRIPNTMSNPAQYELAAYSPDFVTMNAQVSKSFMKGWDVYVGMENIGDYRQDQPILAAEEPFGSYFDGSMVWGPIFGRMTYLGFRYRIN